MAVQVCCVGLLRPCAQEETMRSLQIAGLTIALSLTACQQSETPDTTTSEPELETPAAVAAVATVSSIAVPPALAESLAARSDADRARDAGRKPGQVVAFLGIGSGMTVLDVFAASGWYSEVLAQAVGPEGTVYAQNTEFLLTMRDGANEKAMAARLADGRLPNVQRLDRELSDLGLAPDSLDAAMFALNFHDVYNSAGAEAAAGFLQTLHQLMKPGGIVGVIDHAGTAGNNNAELHRIEKANVLAVIDASPFTLDAETDILANADDDMSASVFAPGVRGQTNRFVLRLKK
jgi:predicted methyltransferase